MKTTVLLRGFWACAIIAGIQIALNFSAHGQTPSSNQVQIIQGYGQIPARFERNEGQTDSHVRYLTRGGGYSMYFTPSEITMDVSLNTNRLRKEPFIQAKIRPSEFNAETGTIHFILESAQSNAELSAESELPTKVNYFLGNDPTQWHTNISTFGRVRYSGLYPGIDAVFYGNQTHVEYDFRIAPHADPSRIGLKIEGATHLRIDRSGNLILGVGRSEVQLAKPVAYQMVNGIRQTVTATFHLDGDKLGFDLGGYDPEKALVIDPVLSYSTFLGGECVAQAVTVDSAGAAYITGYAEAALTLLSSNAYQSTWGTWGPQKFPAFVAKLNPTGTALEYETYLGGASGANYGNGIAVDSTGNAYVAGNTYSSSFPTTAGSFEPNWKSKSVSGSSGGFITKLNTNGSALIWSSFLTGKYTDLAQAVDVDSNNFCYVAGQTGAQNFPITNAFMSTFPDLGSDTATAFVTKIATNGSSLIYSTYYGGKDGQNSGLGIKVRPDGSVLVCGVTAALNFPVTNAVQPTAGDSTGATFDAVLFSLSANGQTNLFSTYFGGKTNDWAYGVGYDTNGYIYLSGKTWSTNFPTTNALQSQLNLGSNRTNSDGFIAKFSTNGQQLIFSTFLGGSYNDDTQGAVVQPNGDTIIVGQTGSIDFAPYDNYGSINSGAFDGFVCKLNAAGTVLMNFAYLGGTNSDAAWDVTVDANENAYVVGSSTSPDFPISSTNVADPTFNCANDQFMRANET